MEELVHNRRHRENAGNRHRYQSVVRPGGVVGVDS